MKRMGRILPALLLAVCLFAACGSTEAPPTSEPEAESSVSAPEESSEPEPEPQPEPSEPASEPEPEPEIEADAPPFQADTEPYEGTGEPLEQAANAATTNSALTITFKIMDKQGNPVAKIFGGVEQKSDMAISYMGIGMATGETVVSDADGNLVWDLTSMGELPAAGAYTLILTDSNNPKITQRVGINIPDREGPLTYDITWEHDHPGDVPPPQTSGFIFTFVDASGNPVAGVEMGGSPYPLDRDGAVPSIAMILDPSDAQGKIYWKDVTGKGTYHLYAYKDGTFESYTFQHPGGEQVVELTYTWNH